jgi:hypothetical protein
MVKNALNTSEFNDQHKTRIENLTIYLAYAIVSVVLMQYILMAWRLGSSNAMSLMFSNLFLYYFLIMIIIANLGKIEITKSKWTSIFEEDKTSPVNAEKETFAKSALVEKGINYEEMQLKYGKWENAERSVLFGFAVPIIALLIFSFSGVASFRHLILNQHCEFIILPQVLYRIPPALFLSIFISGIFGNVLYKYLMGKQIFKEYDSYTKLKNKALISIGQWCMTFIMCTVLFTMWPLLSDCYIEVRDNEIANNKFFSIGEKTYDYCEVSTLNHVKSSHEPYYEIVFQNGDIISLYDILYSVDFEKQTEIINFISRKSGKAIQVVKP